MTKKIIFHPYALYKMRKRRISSEKVVETLTQPSEIADGKFGRKIAQRVYGSHVLRVIFEEHPEHILVITTYPAKAERYLRENLWI